MSRKYDITKTKNLSTNPPNFEIVKWMDHCNFHDSGWKTVEDIVGIEPMQFFTSGWVVKETPVSITVVSTASRDGGPMTSEMNIVKKAIIARWVIKDPSLRKGK